MEYITEILGVDIVRSKWKQVDKLPYFLLNEYHFEAVSLADRQCLFLKPIGELGTIGVIKFKNAAQSLPEMDNQTPVFYP